MLLLFLFSIPLLAFSFKANSSKGRLLIYKISIDILSDKFPKGVGMNNFPKVYLDYQTVYFQRGDYSTKELLLADNTKHAFNDYLELLIEAGLSGLLVLLIAAFAMLVLIKKALSRNPKLPNILLFACVHIVAIALAALFTHVMDNIVFKILLVVSTVTIVSYCFRISIRFFISISAFCVFFVSYQQFSLWIHNYSQYKEFEKSRRLFSVGFLSEASKSYAFLYPFLKKDPEFLVSYADLLSSRGMYREAEELLREVLEIDNGNLIHLKLANAMDYQHKSRQAEIAFLKSVNMVPNRFVPRFGLFNFYLRNGQKSKARNAALAIIKLPIKVPSDQVYFIKQAARNFIGKTK